MAQGIFQFADPVSAARFHTAAKTKGWEIFSCSPSTVTIQRKKGLPRKAVYLGIATIPLGIGLLILCIHGILLKCGPKQQRSVPLSVVESGFYPDLLR